MLDLLDGRATERTELAMVRSRPLPFPPEPAASIGINLTRWSLDRADHNDGKRNLLPEDPRRRRPRLRLLTAAPSDTPH